MRGMIEGMKSLYEVWYMLNFLLSGDYLFQKKRVLVLLPSPPPPALMYLEEVGLFGWIVLFFCLFVF